jgi:hypothetical protein
LRIADRLVLFIVKESKFIKINAKKRMKKQEKRCPLVKRERSNG